MIFVFFGHPGAGKTTLARRFGALHGIPAIDTDRFMTADERRAVVEGRYTAEMRHANIRRYCERVRRQSIHHPHVALADGLPTDASRRYLLQRLPAGAVVLVLVHTERRLWERRLAERAENPVEIGVAAADAYIRASWETVPPDLPHETIANDDDAIAVNAGLRELYQRYVGTATPPADTAPGQ